MLEVLNQFVCDECGQIIKIPQEGIVEWIKRRDENKKEYVEGFRIIHTQEASPLRKGEKEGCCRYNKHPGCRNMPLPNVLSVANAFVLHFLNPGYFRCSQEESLWNECKVTDFYEYTNFARRITVPYYEEVRFHFNRWIEDEKIDLNTPYYDYKEEFLIHLIETYGGYAETKTK
ncbi:MAG: hypothetical protein LUG51_14715 [Tannerellaceae bacterium]|nr:hypothetical protein [Tannerellaceae bacterium]